MRIAALISALTLLLVGPALAEMEKPKSSDSVAEDTSSSDTMKDNENKPADPGKVESSDPHPEK